MREEDFISIVTDKCSVEDACAELKKGLPLGLDAAGELVLSQRREHSYTAEHTCVTGTRRTLFIRRLLFTLSCIYQKHEANFLVFSPRTEYGELLRLQGVDATVPYVRNMADVELGKACIRELISQYSSGEKFPKLFLILDGLEELPESGKGGDLEEYRYFLELVAREKNIHVISGVDLMKSIFSGNPGVFVGVGNCLVTTREEGRADVTYVDDDHSLSMPTGMTYPDAPAPLETIIYLNAQTAKTKEENEE